MMVALKYSWSGEILGVQPRIRLLRSFDQVSHTYLGYALWMHGEVRGETRDFTLGVGKEAHAKHQFRVGDLVRGECAPVADPRMETVEYYKASGLKFVSRSEHQAPPPPPWITPAPELPVYRSRGHRRLAAETYTGKCMSCVWGCHMAVEMIIDQWKPDVRRYRTETFCYGPKTCRVYRPGAKRVVPGRKGMRHVEEDWVDEDATAHRADEE